jgi:hypothetical protein
MNEFARTTLAGGAAGAIAGVTTAVVIPLLTPLITYSWNERQTELKKLELSVGVLRDTPKRDDDPVRVWALSVLEKQGYKFTQAQRDVVLKAPAKASN